MLAALLMLAPYGILRLRAFDAPLGITKYLGSIETTHSGLLQSGSLCLLWESGVSC